MDEVVMSCVLSHLWDRIANDEVGAVLRMR